MKYYLKIDKITNEIAGSTISNDPTILFDNTINVIDITDYPQKDKIIEKSYYFKYINGVLQEKNDLEKKIEDDKRLVKTSTSDTASRLAKIEDRLTILEQSKK